MATYSSIKTNRLADVQRQPIEIINRGETSFKDDLLEIVEGIQADRSEMLSNVRDLQLAAQLLLAAESARIAALVPDDDRIVALLNSSRKIADRVAMIDQEIGVAASRVPMVKKTEALVYGRITDDASRAVGPVTVTLADEKGVAVPGVPPVEVDSAGYYAIVVPADTAAAIAPDSKFTITVGNGAERVTADVAPIGIAAGGVKVQDVALDDARIDRLKLRLAVNTRTAGGIRSAVSRTAVSGRNLKSAATKRKKAAAKKA